MRFLLQQRRF